MFFQLDQISRLDQTTSELQKAKDKLNSYIIDAYKPEPTVKKSLSRTIQSIITISNTKLRLFEQIQSDAQNGYLVPSYLDYEKLTSERVQLPQWTQVVFEKQYEKQKKSLDVMAKKIFAVHSLTEAKDKLVRQLNSFKILSDRYKVLSQHDEIIDIMAEAEKVRTLTQLTNDKFLTYCNVIAQRLTAFGEEMASKCSNFSAQLNNFVDKTKTSWVHPQQNRQPYSQPKTVQTQSGWLSRANRTLERPIYRNTQVSSNFIQKQPRWLQTYTSDFYS